MDGSSTFAALVVASFSILTAQLIFQLIATASILRKCDQTVTGGLTKGGRRKWHWRQAMFTVHSQVVVFTLPAPVCRSLGVSPIIQISQDSKTDSSKSIRASLDLWQRALRTRKTRNCLQTGWASLVQDLTFYQCLEPQNLGLREVSGDHIPQDLTIATTHVDALTILLTGISMGMQVYRYKPTAGVIIMGGGVGNISSSAHPVLGGLLHYNIFSEVSNEEAETIRRYGKALSNEQGVWANAVFGNFRDRSFQDDFFPLLQLIESRCQVLIEHGWPHKSTIDTTAGAACFLTFAHVDIFESGAPSTLKRYTAHFAEFLVSWHLEDLISCGLTEIPSDSLLHNLFHRRIDTAVLGYSSPHLNHFIESLLDLDDDSDAQLWEKVTCSTLIVPPHIVDMLDRITARDSSSLEYRSPSTYIQVSDAWEIVKNADHCLSQISRQDPAISQIADHIMAKAVCILAEVGCPEWEFPAAEEARSTWSKNFADASECIIKYTLPDIVKDKLRHPVIARQAPRYARIALLRAAYFTIMMRAAHDVGPGLTHKSIIETSLLHMA